MKRLLLAGLSRLGAAGSAIGRRHELGVAAAAAAALRHQHALALVREIGHETTPAAVVLEHERADRNVDLEIVGGMTSAVRALSVPAASGLELGVIAEVDERVLGGNRDDVDRSARAAVAAIWSAARHELLATKTQAAIATGPGCD